VSTATFIYMMLVLKLPILALLWIVWWAIRSTPEVDAGEDDGGTRRSPHWPKPPRTPRPRRGPHAEPPPPAPARTRSVVARGRDPERT
jgi:hypothetical protein